MPGVCFLRVAANSNRGFAIRIRSPGRPIGEFVIGDAVEVEGDARKVLSAKRTTHDSILVTSCRVQKGLGGRAEADFFCSARCIPSPSCARSSVHRPETAPLRSLLPIPFRKTRQPSSFSFRAAHLEHMMCGMTSDTGEILYAAWKGFAERFGSHFDVTHADLRFSCAGIPVPLFNCAYPRRVVGPAEMQTADDGFFGDSSAAQASRGC